MIIIILFYFIWYKHYQCEKDQTIFFNVWSDADQATGSYYSDPNTGSDVTPGQEKLLHAVVLPYFTSVNSKKNKNDLQHYFMVIIHSFLSDQFKVYNFVILDFCILDIFNKEVIALPWNQKIFVQTSLHKLF